MLISDGQLIFIRYASELIIIVSNFAVWRGVYLEQNKFSEETQHRGWRMLIRGLALETAFGAFLFAADTTLSDRQQAALEPRDITVPTNTALLDFARTKSPTVLVTSYAFDAEGGRLAGEIVSYLKRYKIRVVDDSFTLRPARPSGYGVFVSGSDFALATALLAWANENGLHASPTEMPSEGIDKEYAGGFRPALPTVDAIISVGLKPLPAAVR